VAVKGRLLLAPFPRVGQPDQAPQPDPGADPNSSNIIEPFFVQFPLASARALQQFQFSLSEGYLLGVVVAILGAIPRKGQCYVQVFLSRAPIGGGIDLVPLISNYISGEFSPGWPLGSPQQSVDGAGVIRSVQQANPAAGADFTITVPTGARWRVQALRANLTTSAAVANRTVQTVVDDGVNTNFIGPFLTAQTAGQSLGYTAYPGGGNPYTILTEQGSPLPSPTVMFAGARIRSLTANLQAADQWSLIFIDVEEWLEI